MEKKPNIAMKVFGWLAVFCISVATLFKIMHWPGANAGTLIGTISFLLFYLPLWLINEPKKGRKLNLAYQFFILFLTFFVFFFKTLHLPGAGLLFNIWLNLSVLVVLPVSFFQLFLAGKKTSRDFHFVIILFLLGSLIFIGIGGSASRADFMAASFSKSTARLANSFQRLQTKNKQLYSAFDQLENKDKSEYYLRSQKLKLLTDSAEKYIRAFRNNLIALTEEVTVSAADSISITRLRNKVDAGISTGEICGFGMEPIKGKFTGTELKTLIETYRDSVIKFIEGENKNFIKAGINLDTEPQMNEHDEEMEDWVFATFKEIPITAVLLTLENIKYEIKNAETQVLSDLLNNASKNSGNDLASKIADLGVKLEDEKKQREIENLQKERELSKLRMNAKNVEIDEAKQTIILFVVGLLICSIMIFFIIRSNLLRKKTNLELIAQKHLIEEKNKEITDSINYAKRIQQAHMPTEKFIESKLKRMMKN